MTAEDDRNPGGLFRVQSGSDAIPVAFTATQSRGTSNWVVVDVPAGTNGLACFFPDISDGLPSHLSRDAQCRGGIELGPRPEGAGAGFLGDAAPRSRDQATKPVDRQCAHP